MALSFQEDLQQLLNRHSAETPSGTPDYILAEMITNVLKTFNEAVGQRAEWRGESMELPAMQKLFETPSSMDDCAACHSMMDDIREESSVDDDYCEACMNASEGLDNDHLDHTCEDVTQSDEVEATFSGGGDIHIHIEAPRPAEYSFFQRLIGEQNR